MSSWDLPPFGGIRSSDSQMSSVWGTKGEERTGSRFASSPFPPSNPVSLQLTREDGVTLHSQMYEPFKFKGSQGDTAFSSWLMYKSLLSVKLNRWQAGVEFPKGSVHLTFPPVFPGAVS